MNALILMPREAGTLAPVALELQAALHRHGIENVAIVGIADISDAEITGAGMVIIGTPSLNGDIHWPVQVAVDALAHRLRRSLDGIVVSGFTVLPGTCKGDDCPGLAPVLWAFNETRAIVVPGIELSATWAPDRARNQLDAFVAKLSSAREREKGKAA